MYRNILSKIILFLFCVGYCLGDTGKSRDQVACKFPGADSFEILCWSEFKGEGGFVSQILVSESNGKGPSQILWQSPLEPAYSPKIRFITQIAIEGVPIALVERQTGAASSQLDVIGKVGKRMGRILQIDGSAFDVENLGGSKTPYVISHNDEGLLDVPMIFRWNGNSFVDDSGSHPDYYRQLLVKYKAELPPDSAGIILLKLSKVALLSGNRTEAKTILNEALIKEGHKGEAQDKETLKSIADALKDLDRSK